MNRFGPLRQRFALFWLCAAGAGVVYAVGSVAGWW